MHNSRPNSAQLKAACTITYFYTFYCAIPRKSDFTLKILCMHHMIPNPSNYPSGNFHSWLFDWDHGGNRTTKLCLATYLIPLYMTVWKTSKSYTLDVAYNVRRVAVYAISLIFKYHLHKHFSNIVGVSCISCTYLYSIFPPYGRREQLAHVPLLSDSRLRRAKVLASA